jgi:hypothetical protein
MLNHPPNKLLVYHIFGVSMNSMQDGVINIILSLYLEKQIG